MQDYIDMVEKLADSRLVEIRRLQGEMTKQRQVWSNKHPWGSIAAGIC